MRSDAPKLRRYGARQAADAAAIQFDLGSLDAFEHNVLHIARYFFETFSSPPSRAWIEAFGEAERLFPVPFGASIAHAVLIAIKELRASRRRTFEFERPDTPCGTNSITDTERYFIRILHDIRGGNRASARAHALFLCEGNDASRVLAAFERLAIITGDVDDLHFN